MWIFSPKVTKVSDLLSAPCNSQGTLKDKQLAELWESIKSITTRQDLKQTVLKNPEDVHVFHYNTLLSLFKSIVDVLEIIEKDGSYRDQRRGAGNILHDILNFEFAFSMHLMVQILGCTSSLSQALQRYDQDIVKCKRNATC